MKFCRHCGTRSTPGSRICLDCGAAYETEAVVAPPPPQPTSVLESFPTPPGWKGPAWTFVAAYAGALVLIAGVLGFLWWRSQSGVPDMSTLARLAPRDARLFAAVSLDVGVADLKQLHDWKKALEETEAGREALRQFESTVGSSVEDVAGWALPAGFVTLQPVRTGEAPSALWVLRVRSEAGARKAVERFLADSGATPAKVGGFDGWTSGGQTVVVGRGYLVVGSPAAQVEAALERAGSKSAAGLADDEEFQRALRRVVERPELLVWANLPGLREDAAPLLTMAPTPAVLALADLRSAAIGSSRRSGEWTSRGFLGVSSAPGSGLVRAMMRKPARNGVDPAAFAPADTSLFLAQDLTWTMGLVRELVAMSGGPDPFREAGLDVNALLANVGGPVGFAMQARELLPESRGSEPSALLVVGSANPAVLESSLASLAKDVKADDDFRACQSNERNIGTALEMWSTDNSGRYPASLSFLTPNYLRAIPTCPSAGRDTYSGSYTSRTMPDDYAFSCTGSHADVGAPFGYPRYDGMQGLDPGVLSSAPVSSAAPRQTSTHSGQVMQGLTSGSTTVWWAQRQKPSGLIVGFGPRSKALVEAGIDSRDSLADDPGYRSLAGAAKGAVVSTMYVDLEPFLPTLVDSNPELARKLLGESTGLVLSVQDDGLQLDMKGAGPAVLAGMGAALVAPNFVRARGTGQFTACKSNLKNLGTALEMWSTDNGGHYPTDLAQLAPNYLRSLPTCPSAGTATYTAGYVSSAQPDGYTVVCTGHHHAASGVAPNYPQYNYVQGLVER